MPRLPLIVAAGSIVLAACGVTEAAGDQPSVTERSTSTATAVSEPDADSTDSTTSSTTSATESSPRNVTVSGFEIWRAGFAPDGVPEPLVHLDEIRSGGPPPDGIPPIDDPKYLAIDDVDFLSDNEPVLAFELNGEARAYPVQIMTWHEIVNDTIGGVPVTISYCPLCNSAIAYDRRLDDLVVDFGTSGLLWNSALVMYDRQTETLWSHFTGEGIVGELTGVELTSFPLATVAWSTWRDANPDGRVLSRDTGSRRDYGRNPYPGYDNVDAVPFLFQGEVDGRYTAMTRFVGVEHNDEAVGVPLIGLQETRIVEGTVGGDDIVVWWTPGTASALDAPNLANGRDVGATGVFVPVIDGRALTFRPLDSSTFIDGETGSTWNVLGAAIDGELAGSQLTALPHVDTFWFAWSTFRSDTTVLSQPT
jgi:hypothetical protein